MISINNIQAIQKLVNEYKSSGKTIGFIPTMGYLHEGHLSLVNKARKENDIIICSIFVNPLQFGPNEDFERYPRDTERDEMLLDNANVDILFNPTVKEMYPQEPSIKVHVTDRVDQLCGTRRPGHFDGVATVLMKLFNITSPDRVYMGKKDAQQIAVVELLLEEFNFPLQLVPCETIREEDGLAKSSRNVYLTIDERAEAPYIYKSLLSAKETIVNGESSVKEVISKIQEQLSMIKNGEVDYIDVLSFPSLKSVDVISGTVIVAIAYKFQSARLIDNLIIKTDR
jgi:pantoate--beta-alanine ligase